VSPDTQIYDVDSYQPASCVGQLMYRVRSAQMSALDQALAQDPELAALEILDNFGQRSVLSFSRVEVNPKLPAESFQFKPPVGADVIRQ